MELRELVNLITIRQYVSNSVGNPAIDRATVTEMNHTLLLIDRKIIALLKHEEFKEYINFSDIKQVVKAVAEINNIRSGMTNR